MTSNNVPSIQLCKAYAFILSNDSKFTSTVLEHLTNTIFFPDRQLIKNVIIGYIFNTFVKVAVQTLRKEKQQIKSHCHRCGCIEANDKGVETKKVFIIIHIAGDLNLATRIQPLTLMITDK